MCLVSKLSQENYSVENGDYIQKEAEIEGFGEKRALGILLKTELCQKHSKSCMQFCLGALNKKPVFVVTSACDCKDGNFN